MRVADFELERYFARWESDVAHLLCASDVEPVAMGELLEHDQGWALDLELLRAAMRRPPGRWS